MLTLNITVMAKFRKQNKVKALFLFILCANLSFAQLNSFIRNGVIKSYNQTKDTIIELSYLNDTIFGFYKIKYKNGKTIEEGFRNNFKVKTYYYYSNKPNSKGYFTGAKVIKYSKLLNPKDTFEMLKHDLLHSFKEGESKVYSINGKLESYCKYSIITDKENLSTINHDSCIYYYPSGNIKNIEVITPNYEIENQFYENGLLKNKIYRIMKHSELIYGTHDNYYPSGRLKNTASFSFMGRKKDGIEQEYNEKGQLILVSHFKDGLLIKSLGIDKSGKLKEIKIPPSD